MCAKQTRQRGACHRRKEDVHCAKYGAAKGDDGADIQKAKGAFAVVGVRHGLPHFATFAKQWVRKDDKKIINKEKNDK